MHHPYKAASQRIWTPVDSSYSLVFDEEFNGDSIDTSVWNIANNNTFGSDSNTVSANNVVRNGFLRQQVTNVASGGKSWSGAAIFQWTNTSPNGWLQGYFETRCKMPGPNIPTLMKVGSHPGVWMNNLGIYPENDIAEFFGGDGKVRQNTYEINDPTDGFGFSSGPLYNPADPGAGFHVYGMSWNASGVTFYVDGVQTAQFLDGGTYNVNGTNYVYSVDKTVPQYLLIWHLISIASCGAPNANSVFPYNFYVDYIHIYQQGGAPVAPQTGYGGPGDATGSGSDPGF